MQNWPFCKSLTSWWGNFSHICDQRHKICQERKKLRMKLKLCLTHTVIQSFSFIRNSSDFFPWFCSMLFQKIPEKLKSHGKSPEILFQAFHACRLLSCCFWIWVQVLKGKNDSLSVASKQHCFEMFHVNDIEALNATLRKWFLASCKWFSCCAFVF